LSALLLTGSHLHKVICDIDYGFKENWSLGAQFSFIKSSEEDSFSITTTVPANEVPQFHQVRDRNLLVFGRWFKSGYSNSSFYLGLGGGIANREFSVFEGGGNTRASSSGTIFSGQLGYQWMFASNTGLGFELNFSQSSVDENTTGDQGTLITIKKTLKESSQRYYSPINSKFFNIKNSFLGQGHYP
jgi:hypothetical protein